MRDENNFVLLCASGRSLCSHLGSEKDQKTVKQHRNLLRHLEFGGSETLGDSFLRSLHFKYKLRAIETSKMYFF